MSSKFKKLTVLLLAITMVFALTACGGGSSDGGDAEEQETYTLVFSTHLPETGVDGASLKAYLEDVEAACDGRLEIEMNFAGSEGLHPVHQRLG